MCLFLSLFNFLLNNRTNSDELNTDFQKTVSSIPLSTVLLPFIFFGVGSGVIVKMVIQKMIKNNTVSQITGFLCGSFSTIWLLHKSIFNKNQNIHDKEKYSFIDFLTVANMSLGIVSTFEYLAKKFYKLAFYSYDHLNLYLINKF